MFVNTFFCFFFPGMRLNIGAMSTKLLFVDTRSNHNYLCPKLLYICVLIVQTKICLHCGGVACMWRPKMHFCFFSDKNPYVITPHRKHCFFCQTILKIGVRVLTCLLNTMHCFVFLQEWIVTCKSGTQLPSFWQNWQQIGHIRVHQNGKHKSFPHAFKTKWNLPKIVVDMHIG